MIELPLDATTRIRLIQETDVPAFYALIESNRNYLKRRLPWLDLMTSPEVAQNYVLARIKMANDNLAYCFVIETQLKIVGVIHLAEIDPLNRKAMIGYWVAEAFAGQGLGTKATKALLNHAFQDLRFHRIEIRCAIDNQASEAIPRKLGFKHEGILRQSEWLQERFVDQNLFSMLADEWPNSRSKG